MHGVLHFLKGLEPTVIRTLVTSMVNLLVAGVLVKGFRKQILHVKDAWRDHMQTQKAIADHLDTETPGGLGELKALLKDSGASSTAASAVAASLHQQGLSGPQKGGESL